MFFFLVLNKTKPFFKEKVNNRPCCIFQIKITFYFPQNKFFMLSIFLKEHKNCRKVKEEIS